MKRDRENRDLKNRDRIREHDEVSYQRRREQFVPQPGLSNRDLLPLRDNRDGRDLRNRGREHGRDVRYADSRKCLPDDEHKLRENKYRYRERNKEFEEITEHYSRSKKTRMGVIKPSEKFSFSLDGQNTEDTSRGRNSLYQNPHEAGLLYGRGFRGERDLLEHKKLPADGPDFTAGRHQKEHKKLASDDRGFSPGSDGWGRGFSPGRDLWARGFRTGSDQWVHKTLAAEHKISAANTYDTFGMRVDSHWPDKKRDDRHWIHKKLEEMTERDWIIFLEDNDISFQGSKIPRPLRDWADSKLNAQLLKALERRACYHQPTSIQMAAIPPALEQRDVLAIGKPVTGKTAAFVLPMLNHVSRLPRISEVNEAEGPYAVVMAPTRVLAQEIEDETIKLAYFSGIKVVSIVGGESIEEQGSGVGRGCEVIIATPSRLLDCLERGYVVLNQCICVVLDAADRMIDMGFEPQVVGVLEAMPNSNLKPKNEDAELDEKKIYRSTYMFGCTMTLALEQLAKKYLRNPVVVTVRNPVFTVGPTTENITMIVVMVKESEKGYRLRSLLDELGDKTAMVFVNTKKNADRVAKSLDKAGYRVTPLHSERKSQEEQREESSEDFRTKRCNVLVSTDFGQGGVDVPDVDLVINYDMPCNIEAYVHRIERTYPALKFGVVTTFLTLNDCDVFYAFKRLLREHGSAVPRELARHEAANIIPDRPPVRWKDAVLAH